MFELKIIHQRMTQIRLDNFSHAKCNNLQQVLHPSTAVSGSILICEAQ